MKKVISLVLVVITVLSIFTITTSAINWPSFSRSVPIKVYTISTGNNTTAYSSTSLNSKKGTIYASDELYIEKIGRNSNGTYYAYGSYPISSGRKYAYIPLSVITKASAPSEKITAATSATTYRRASTSNTYGSIDKGDYVYKLTTSGNYTQVLYNVGSKSNPSAWKMAWVKTSVYNSMTGDPGKSLVDVTSNFAGKTITIKSIQNGKYLCADKDIKNTPLSANKSKASTWETFTVSKLTSDGWVGFKASANGKYLSAIKDATNTPVCATASKLQSWECFRIYQKGSDYYIKAQINKNWMSARVDTSNAPVLACVSSASSWERFEISTPSAYNAKKAAEYAVKHAYDTPVYSGSDCARYVSECLAAGGVTVPNKNLYQKGDYTYTGRKFTGPRNPYINAPALLTYLSSKYKVIENPSVSQMKVGDVAFLVSSDGYYDGHAVMITKISNGIAYYSGHTKAQANQRIYPGDYWTTVRYLVKMS